MRPDPLPQLEALLASLRAAAVVFDAGGQVVAASAPALELFGFPDVGAWHRWTEAHPDGLVLRDLDGTDVPRERWPDARAGRGEASDEVVLELHRVDTGARWTAAWSAAPLHLDGRQLVTVSLRPLDRPSPADALSLRESAERFRTLADNMAQLAWMADSTGAVFWLNRRWLDYADRSPEDLDGWSWQQAVHPDHVDRVLASIGQSLEAGEVWEDTFPLRRHDGTYRWFLSRATPIRGADGAVERWFGTNTDITERREAEQALREADQHKDAFLAVLSHELRNPLGPIRNALHILDRAPEGGPQSLQARRVLHRQVSHLTRLVDDLLDVTRISSGKVQLRREPTDLRALARATAEDHVALFAGHAVTFDVELPDGPLWVDADPTRVVQIVGNLLQNASRFTAPGGRVSLRLEAHDDDAVITVRDTGIGMTREALSRVFDPFVQTEEGLRHHHGGLGLGLSLVQGLVELHGGAVTAASDGLAQGSVFEVRLPRCEAPAHLAAQPPAVADAGLRVLIVDDNVDAAETLATLLELQGHEVALAHDGRSAVDRAPRFRPNVVFCDIGLPDLDGYEVARALRTHDHLAEALLVALSGHSSAAHREAAREAGFALHLAKPIDLSEIHQALSSAKRR